MMKILRSIVGEVRGAATIELAIVAPILAAMVVGMSDLSTAYSTKLQVEQVAQRAIEKVQQNGFKTTDETTLETEAATAAGATASANVTFWKECTTSGGARTTVGYTTDCGSGDSYAKYVQIDVQKTYTPIIAARFAGSAVNNSFTVHGIAGVRIQ